MAISEWVKSNVGYGRDLISSGWEGARSRRETALEGVPAASLLLDSVRRSWRSAAVGAYIGTLGAALGSRRRPAYGAIAVSTALGAAIGLVTGMAWGTRHLTADMARGAMKNIGAVRDEHWLEGHPIDYA